MLDFKCSAHVSFSEAGEPERGIGSGQFRSYENVREDSSPGVVGTAAKPRLCLRDTHFFPLPNLLWHKRIIHGYVHILVLHINLPYSCVWRQLPRSPGLSSPSFPLALSTQRKMLPCLPSPEAILPGRSAARGLEKEAGGKRPSEAECDLEIQNWGL